MPFDWKNKRVVITGASGFKGAWLCILLDRLGAKVTGISQDADHPDGIFNIVNSNAFSNHRLANLSNYNEVLASNDLTVCPDHWGGFTFTPFYFEFWKGHDKRLNKREAFKLINNEWTESILQP